MFTDPTTAYVMATMDERLRRAEQARTTKALRRHALAARAEARAAARATAAASPVRHRHPRLWALTHLRHA